MSMDSRVVQIKLTMGRLEKRGPNIMVATRPTRPNINGTRTCGEVQANCTPAQVRAMLHAVELPIIRKQPLQARIGHLSILIERSGDAHPIHAAQLLTDSPFRDLQFEGRQNQDHRNSTNR